MAQIAPTQTTRPSRRSLLHAALAAAALRALPACSSSSPQSATNKTPANTPPNIILILADDVGYGDLACYGATKIKTPNLDRLASQGLRFTDAHSPSAMCTPTRYSILTGEYAWRGAAPRGVLNGDASLIIPTNSTTLPSLLKSAGYSTAAVGKWHLGLGEKPKGPDYNADLKPGPLEVGFDHFFGYSATNDRVPCVYIENHRVVGLDPNDPIQISHGSPVGNEPTGKNNPELLRVKPSHGHDNTIINGISRIGYMTGGAKARWKDEEMTETFTNKATSFIEKNRNKPFFLYFAPPNIHVPRTPGPRFAGKSAHGTRGDVLEELDYYVGQLLSALDRLNLADNTLVIFTSDNGGVMDDGYQDGSGSDTSGHRCNNGLRGYKGGLYEGGHRVPFIARWPNHFPKGQLSHQLLCLTDLLATAAAIAHSPLPPNSAPDSLNLLPALLNPALSNPIRSDLVMHAGSGALAIRQGPWKLIPRQPGPRGGVQQQPQLYNLAADLAETTNLFSQHPDVAQRLGSLLETRKATPKSN